MTTIEQRKMYWDAMPKMALEPIHLLDSKLVTSRLEMLDLLPKGIRALEIGVAEGSFSHEIWNRLVPSHLTLVDPWEGERYSPGFGKVTSAFSEQVTRGAVSIVKSMSVDFLKSCQSNSFDFVYIDTNHTYNTTLQELREASNVIAPGGYIAGHDYTVGNVVTPVVYGVIQAVNQFCVEEGWRIKFLTVEPAGWNSFALQRI